MDNYEVILNRPHKVPKYLPSKLWSKQTPITLKIYLTSKHAGMR